MTFDVLEQVEKKLPIVEDLFLNDDMCKLFNNEIVFIKELASGADGQVFLVEYDDGEIKEYVLKRTIHYLYDFFIKKETEQFAVKYGIKSILDKFKNSQNPDEYKYKPPDNIKPCKDGDKYSCKNEEFTWMYDEDGIPERFPGKNAQTTGVVIVSEYVISTYLSNLYKKGLFFNFLEISNFSFCENTKNVMVRDGELFDGSMKHADQSSSFILMEKADGYIGARGDGLIGILERENKQDELGSLFLQCAMIVGKLNSEGIVHHDLHGKNLMYMQIRPGMMWNGVELTTVDYFSYTIGDLKVYFKSNYLVKIIDFGRARWYDMSASPPKVKVENGNLGEWKGIYPKDYTSGFDMYSILSIPQFRNRLNTIRKDYLKTFTTKYYHLPIVTNLERLNNLSFDNVVLHDSNWEYFGNDVIFDENNNPPDGIILSLGEINI